MRLKSLIVGHGKSTVPSGPVIAYSNRTITASHVGPGGRQFAMTYQGDGTIYYNTWDNFDPGDSLVLSPAHLATEWLVNTEDPADWEIKATWTGTAPDSHFSNTWEDIASGGLFAWTRGSPGTTTCTLAISFRSTLDPGTVYTFSNIQVSYTLTAG